MQEIYWLRENLLWKVITSVNQNSCSDCDGGDVYNNIPVDIFPLFLYYIVCIDSVWQDIRALHGILPEAGSMPRIYQAENGWKRTIQNFYNGERHVPIFVFFCQLSIKGASEKLMSCNNGKNTWSFCYDYQSVCL